MIESTVRKAAFLLPFVAACCVPALRAAEPLGRWEEVALPGTRYRTVSDIAIEPGGTLWVMAGDQVYYLDGEELKPPGGAKLTSGTYLAGLYGGSDRPLYASQPGKEEQRGALYRLSDGEARHVTDFSYDVTSQPPGLYVARSGKVYNWGKPFLAVYSGGKWTRIDASLSLRRTVIVDAGEAVHFYYDGKLYRADARDRLTVRDLPMAILAPEGQSAIVGALWGTDRMLTLSHGAKGLRVHDLATLEPLFLPRLRGIFQESSVYDLFRARDGAVWVLADDPHTEGRVFRRIAPDGGVSRVDATAGMDWESNRCWQYPQSVLNASDGSMWFGLPRDGVARYQAGALRVFGWKDGLAEGGARRLVEGREGTIYACGYRSIYRFRPDQPPGPPPANVGLWQEFALASYQPIRDSRGNVWMFLKERPGTISCWDGARWRHVAVPFDTAKVYRGMADDRGRLLLRSPEGAFLIGPAGVERHEDTKAMLEWAIVDGARRFAAGPGYQGCVVLDGGRLWYGLYNRRTSYYFDGAGWHTVYFPDSVYHLNESVEHGVVFGTQSRRYYTYAEGWPRAIWATRRAYTQWLLGAKGYQPFEEQLLKRRPGACLPLVWRGEGAYSLLVPPEDPDDERLTWRGKLRSGFRTVTPGFHGGWWTEQAGRGTLARRIFGGSVVPCRYTGTPLAGWYYSVQKIIEDRGHNLWFYVGPHRGARRVCLKRLSGFRLKLGEVPAEATRSVKVTAEPVLPGLDAEQLRLFWRFKGGAWRGGLVGGAATIRFPADGEYVVELLGMDRQGGTTAETESFVVRARVPLPDTKLTAQGRYRANDVVWRAPVQVVPSEAGAQATLMYRIDGGSWRPARSRGSLYLSGVSPGQHVVELAAREQGFYRDRSPLRLSLTYAPDFEHIVSSRLERLGGERESLASRAAADIRLAGAGAIPALRRKLAAAGKQSRLARRLQLLLTQMERQYKQSGQRAVRRSR